MHLWRAVTVALVSFMPFALVGCGTSESGTPALASLLSVDTEAPGANCAAGGVAIRNGTDTDGNGQLSDTEASTHYVCNGVSIPVQPGAEAPQPPVPKQPEEEAATAPEETDEASPEPAVATRPPTVATESTKDPAKDADFEEVLSAATAAVKDTRFEQGLRLCKRAIRMQPDDQGALMTCTIAACNLKDGTRAKTYLRKIKSDTRKAGLRQICLRSGVDMD